jgi:hypothetical protein
MAKSVSMTNQPISLDAKIFKGIIFTFYKCCNLSLGLTTKARGCKVAGQERDLGVTSHAPESAKSVRE